MMRTARTRCMTLLLVDQANTERVRLYEEIDSARPHQCLQRKVNSCSMILQRQVARATILMAARSDAGQGCSRRWACASTGLRLCAAPNSQRPLDTFGQFSCRRAEREQPGGAEQTRNASCCGACHLRRHPL